MRRYRSHYLRQDETIVAVEGTVSPDRDSLESSESDTQQNITDIVVRSWNPGTGDTVRRGDGRVVRITHPLL